MAFRRTENLGVTTALQDAILDALWTNPAAALLDAPRLHLIVNPAAVLSKDYDPADIAADQATFTGYASVLVTAGQLVGPINLTAGRRAIHVEKDWVATAVPNTESVYGYVLTDTGITVLYAWEALTDPVTIVVPGDSVSLDLVVAMTALLAAA